MNKGINIVYFFSCQLKVLILLSPDLGRLKDEQRVQRTQEDVIDALYTYTSSNYKDHLSKYGEILTMCSYITNVSIHFKTFLFNRLKDVETNLTSSSASVIAASAANTTTSSSSDSTAASTSSSPTAAAKNQKSLQQQQQTPHNCGLLMELLKGDLLFQPSYSLMTWHFIELNYILLYTVYIYSRSFYYYYFYSFTFCLFVTFMWYYDITLLIIILIKTIY